MSAKWIAAAGFAAVALAQQQPPFRSGAELVRVDVTVLDGSGKPVTTLTADDFVIEEDGVPQRIASFQLIHLTGQVPADEDPTLTIGTRDTHRLHELARDDVRLIVVFWDEYHIQPDPHGIRIREQLVEFLRTSLSPTDLVAIMDQWTPMSDLTFSRDRYRLANIARGLRGRRGVYVPRNVAEENHMREGPEWARARVAVSALKSTMMHLGSIRESRKVILYVGLEFGLGRDTTSTTIELMEAANAANVAFYSINPQGLQAGGSNFRSGMLAAVADESGGESLVTNSPRLAMERALKQSEASYLIGYSPSPLRHDGKFHKITVKVKKSGYQVRARTGYLAPDAASREKARTEAAAAVLPSHIDAAFSELVKLGRRELEDAPHEARTILVPQDPSPLLAVGAPLLWRVQRPADLKIALAGSDPPFKGREFTRAERIIGRVPLTGSEAATAGLSIALVDRRGKRLSDLPFRRTADGATLDLPLQSFARGDYLVAIEASAGEVKASAYLPLRIVDR